MQLLFDCNIFTHHISVIYLFILRLKEEETLNFETAAKSKKQ